MPLSTSQHIITILSLGCSIIMAIVSIVLIYKRPQPLAEELKDALKDYARKSELKDLKADLQSECRLKHTNVDHSFDDLQSECRLKHTNIDHNFADLYKLDRDQTKAITDRLDAINCSLNDWQKGIERQIGNHDGRIINLEYHNK